MKPHIPAETSWKPKLRKRRKDNLIQIFLRKDGSLSQVAVLLIQVICICTLVGCSVGLFTQWYLTKENPRKPERPQSIPRAQDYASRPERPTRRIYDRRSPPQAVQQNVPVRPNRYLTKYDVDRSNSPHGWDKSQRYQRLREDYDYHQLDEVPRSYSFATHAMDVPNQVPYDIYNCPDKPPKGYPYEWKLVDVIDSWNPDNTIPPKEIYQGLCVFDYHKDYNKAERYRRAELPFIVKNDPDAINTAARWNAPGYVDKMLGRYKYHVEESTNNHFMFWNLAQHEKKGENQPLRKGERHLLTPPVGWDKPTKMVRMSYREWLSHANVTEEYLGPDQPHWYFRVTGCGDTGPKSQCDVVPAEFLFDELPFFQPKESLYIVEPEKQMGIHCRFGMKGVIAENHFDVARNSITVLSGERRYILSHPNQCNNLALYPEGHPSSRHSAVDWSNPDLDQYPEFVNAMGNEVVLQAGDIMYLPTNWFHYIVSLSLNYQCNTRSGTTKEYMGDLCDCGFQYGCERQ